MSLKPSLPIDGYLGDALQKLKSNGQLVLEAEPGAGKTTRFPLALLESGLAHGLIIVVQPRRIAARMVAHYLAETMNESAGDTIGYQVRFEKRVGPKTRVLFMTEGMLLRRMQGDPELKGVGAVIVDEFHERSLALDVMVALLGNLVRARNEKLWLVVMSATMDGQKVAEYLGGAEHISVPGRVFPVEMKHLDVPSQNHLDQQVRVAVGRALSENVDGHILVFLPGVAEIRRARKACEKYQRPGEVEIFDLHGSLALKVQRQALAKTKSRKVILSTNIAETSLTIDGVRAVIDSGLVRESRFNQQRGTSSLVMGNISQASATQRAGRAGRTQEGTCYRLYTRQAYGRFSAYNTPEILRADLAEPMLMLESLGLKIESMPFLDVPPETALLQARGLLKKLCAIDDGGLLKLGKQILRLPLHPRLGRLVLAADEMGMGADGSLLAALLAERDIRQNRDEPLETGDSDLLALRDLFGEVEKAGFSERAIRQARLNVLSVGRVRQVRDQLVRTLSCKKNTAENEEALLQAILLAYPDQVARMAVASGKRKGEQDLVMVGGGRAALHASSVVRGSEWVVALDVEERQTGTDRRTWARQVSRIEPDWLLDYFEDEVEAVEGLEWDGARGRVDSISQLRYGSLVLEESRERAKPDDAVTELLITEAMRKGSEQFVDMGAFESLVRRLEYAREFFPDVDVPEVSRNDAQSQLRLAAKGLTALKELAAVNCVKRAEESLSFEVQNVLRKHLPTQISLAEGRKLTVTYEPDKPPWVQSYLQDFFGMNQGPVIASGRLALTLHLLAPNRRAVQVTGDLSGFWDNHYPGLRQSLMRRYPRHGWPEDPRTASPTRPTRRRKK
jgi:ATP-dependent helicase HrpB